MSVLGPINPYSEVFKCLLKGIISYVRWRSKVMYINCDIFWFLTNFSGFRNHVTGNNGSITSSNTAIFDSYPQSQYCSWLVTVSKNLVVLLNFTYFNVSHCGRNFVKIFDGVNDRTRLLTTYCGSNATSGSTIVSSANNVYVVLKSGTYLEDTEIGVRFQANYISQPKGKCSYLSLTNKLWSHCW